MDSHKYEKIRGYLEGFADIFSAVDGNVSGNFLFEYISHKKDLDDAFRNYFVNEWNENGYPENCEVDENSLIFHFVERENWKEDLKVDLEHWLYGIMNKKNRDKWTFQNSKNFLKNNILSFIEDYFCDTNIKVYSFGVEDEDFLMYNLDYLQNDDYIIVSDEEIYLLHFGMSD